MKNIYFILFFVFGLILCPISGADRLPVETDENQVFSIDTEIKAIGIMSEESSVDWTIDYQRLFINGAYDYGHIHDGKLNRTKVLQFSNGMILCEARAGVSLWGKKYHITQKQG
jgi:hypothetical protein